MKKIILIIILCFPFYIKAIGTSANAAILMDQDSGRILYASNMNEVRSVASISKVMTAVLAIESGKLKNKIVIGDEIAGAHGSGIYIKKGEILTLEDLVYGLMLRSGNDASLAIANYVGGSIDQFVKQMNEKAIQLGMKNTTYYNPNGLDDDDKGNYSTAYDMAILMSYAMKNTDFAKIVGTSKYKLKTNMNTYIWYNKNKLLSQYSYTTGGKTGFTKKARRTLVTSASKDGLNLVAVTLNDGNDFQDHINLFEYGFANYQNYQVLKKGNLKIDDKYYKNYNLYIKNDITYPLQVGEKESLHIKYEMIKNQIIKKETKVGTIHLYLGDKDVKQEIIYASPIEKQKNKKSFFEKIKDWFQHLW